MASAAMTLILLTAALWIVTHTISREIPRTANAPKPLSCQLCLSGWICLATGAKLALGGLGIWGLLLTLALWAGAVLIERIYNRLGTIIL